MQQLRDVPHVDTPSTGWTTRVSLFGSPESIHLIPAVGAVFSSFAGTEFLCRQADEPAGELLESELGQAIAFNKIMQNERRPMTWIIFALGAVLAWGMYGPALHRG